MANYDFKGPPDNNLTTTEVLLWNMGILLRQILEAGGGNVPVPLDVNVINVPSVSVVGEVEVKNDSGNPLSVNVSNTPNVNVSNEVEVKNDSGNPLSVSVSGGTENITFSTVSTPGPGTIAASAKSLVIITDSNFSGTFGGDSYTGEQTIPVGASLGSSLVSIAYNLIAGTFKIIRIQ